MGHASLPINHWLDSGTIMSCTADEVLIGWGKRQWYAHPIAAHDTPFFYFPDFFFSIDPWFTHEHYTKIDVKTLIKFLEGIDTSPPPKLNWSNSNRLLFENVFTDLQKAFHSQQLKKAVPFVFETSTGTMSRNQLITSLLSALRHVQMNTPLSLAKHLYGFWSEEEGILGVTPEILFRFTGEHSLETVACAGTISTKHNEESLLHDPKELEEHQLVVKGITESLTPYGNVTIDDLKVLKSPYLAHLITPIFIDFETTPSFSTVVNALHPTPALGAIPKENGKTWLLEYEKKINRQRFGAPVGYFHSTIANSLCYVAIRNVQWNTTQLKIGAGCGVIAESQCEHEWNEMNLKLQTIKKTLSL